MNEPLPLLRGLLDAVARLLRILGGTAELPEPDIAGVVARPAVACDCTCRGISGTVSGPVIAGAVE